MNKRNMVVAACAALVAVTIACNGRSPDTGSAPTADFPEAVAAPAPSGGGGSVSTQSVKGDCEPTSTVLCANFESASPSSATVEFFNPRNEPRAVNVAAWRFKDRNSQVDQVLVNVTHGTVPAGGRLTLTVAGAGCDTQYDASGSPHVPPTADLYGSPNYGLLIFKVAEGGECFKEEVPACRLGVIGDPPEEQPEGIADSAVDMGAFSSAETFGGDHQSYVSLIAKCDGYWEIKNDSTYSVLVAAGGNNGIAAGPVYLGPGQSYLFASEEDVLVLFVKYGYRWFKVDKQEASERDCACTLPKPKKEDPR